jgi:hypothetical protein
MVIINDILDFFKIEADKMIIEKVNFFIKYYQNGYRVTSAIGREEGKVTL